MSEARTGFQKLLPRGSQQRAGTRVRCCVPRSGAEVSPRLVPRRSSAWLVPKFQAPRERAGVPHRPVNISARTLTRGAGKPEGPPLSRDRRTTSARPSRRASTGASPARVPTARGASCIPQETWAAAGSPGDTVPTLTSAPLRGTNVHDGPVQLPPPSPENTAARLGRTGRWFLRSSRVSRHNPLLFLNKPLLAGKIT